MSTLGSIPLEGGQNRYNAYSSTEKPPKPLSGRSISLKSGEEAPNLSVPQPQPVGSSSPSRLRIIKLPPSGSPIENQINRTNTLANGSFPKKVAYSAGDFVSMGQKELDNNNPNAAIKYFENALNLSPGLLMALLELGRAHLELGNTDRADNYFNTALTRSNNELTVQGIKIRKEKVCDKQIKEAKAYLNTNPQLALQKLNSIVDRNRNSTSALLARADCYNKLGQNDSAINDLVKARTMDPELSEVVDQKLSEYHFASQYFYKPPIDERSIDEKVGGWLSEMFSHFTHFFSPNRESLSSQIEQGFVMDSDAQALKQHKWLALNAYVNKCQSQINQADSEHTKQALKNQFLKTLKIDFPDLGMNSLNSFDEAKAAVDRGLTS